MRVRVSREDLDERQSVSERDQMGEGTGRRNKVTSWIMGLDEGSGNRFSQ